MPIFDFECLDCHEIFEDVILSSNKEEKTQCPKCGSEKAKKLIHFNGSIQFKGPGFYKTDYKGK